MKLSCKLFLIPGLNLLIVMQGISQVFYGVNNYTQYHQGSLPIIISAPHGGGGAPASIPDRTCNNPTTVTDSRTIELSRQIDTALFNLTGCRPHLIICNLKRTKIDCNRNKADGACGNPEAEIAWTEFQNFIDTAQTISKNEHSGLAFYIDLHGHGKPVLRLELGYGLSGNKLNQADSTLNTASSIAGSSFNNLVETNVSGSTHAELIRGPNALGTMLVNAGFPSVPSQQTPGPDTTDYFSGGYNTFNHTCLTPGNTANGLQIECHSTVRNTYINRKIFADSLAKVLVKFLDIHQNLNLLANCGLPPNNIENSTPGQAVFIIFPNPANDVVQVSTTSTTGNYEISLLNSTGQVVYHSKNQNKFSIAHFPAGLYFVGLKNESQQTSWKKLIKQ